MLARLMANWVYGGFLAELPHLRADRARGRDMTAALVLVALQLPVYMLHQYEEHDDDRFRRFANRVMGGGVELLTVPAVFVINIGGVWILCMLRDRPRRDASISASA